MSEMASKITGDSIVFSTVCSGADQRKHQSSASLVFVRGIHRLPVNSLNKGPATRKCFHLMTSSCSVRYFLESIDLHCVVWRQTCAPSAWGSCLFLLTLACRYRHHKGWGLRQVTKSPFVCALHYTDVIMTTMASQITSLTVVYSTVYSDGGQRKHQSSVSPGPVNSPHTKGQ